MINNLFDEEVALTSRWQERSNGKYYCMEYNVIINQFEYITKIPWFERSYYMPFLDHYKNNYLMLDEVNAYFLRNLLFDLLWVRNILLFLYQMTI